MLPSAIVCWSSVLAKLLPLCCQLLWSMAPESPSEDLPSLDSEDALSAGALGFMPRLRALTTLPHRSPESHPFERVNGRRSLQMRPPRFVGLPCGSFPRLLLAWLMGSARKPTLVPRESLQAQLGANSPPAHSQSGWQTQLNRTGAELFSIQCFRSGPMATITRITITETRSIKSVHGILALRANPRLCHSWGIASTTVDPGSLTSL